MVLQPDGITTALDVATLPVENGTIALPEDRSDLSYVSVFNRYGTGAHSTGIIQNYGLTAGAIASTIAHDGHNLIVIYRDAQAAAAAVNALIESRGGIAYVAADGTTYVQQLEVGGLMTTRPPEEAARGIDALSNAYARDNNGANAMSIATRSLTVLPTVVITDLGFVDTIHQQLIPFVVQG